MINLLKYPIKTFILKKYSIYINKQLKNMEKQDDKNSNTFQKNNTTKNNSFL